MVPPNRARSRRSRGRRPRRRRARACCSTGGRRGRPAATRASAPPAGARARRRGAARRGREGAATLRRAARLQISERSEEADARAAEAAHAQRRLPERGEAHREIGLSAGDVDGAVAGEELNRHRVELLVDAEEAVLDEERRHRLGRGDADRARRSILADRDRVHERRHPGLDALGVRAEALRHGRRPHPLARAGEQLRAEALLERRDAPADRRRSTPSPRAASCSVAARMTASKTRTSSQWSSRIGRA